MDPADFPEQSCMIDRQIRLIHLLQESETGGRAKSHEAPNSKKPHPHVLEVRTHAGLNHLIYVLLSAFSKVGHLGASLRL